MNAASRRPSGNPSPAVSLCTSRKGVRYHLVQSFVYNIFFSIIIVQEKIKKERKKICTKFDFFVRQHRLRAVNVYAPAQMSLSNKSFPRVRCFLPRIPPFISFGGFQLFSMRLPRYSQAGPGPDKLERWEVRRFAGQFDIRNVCCELYGSTFTATRSRTASSSRLDRAYFPAALTPYVSKCEVLSFLSTAGYVSDLTSSCSHRPSRR